MKTLIPLPKAKVDEFVTEYYSRVYSAGHIRYTKQFIICPVGKIKSGKSTLSELLSNALHIPKVSNDDVRIMLRIENNYTSEDHRKIVPIVIRKLVENNYSIIIDSNCASAHTRSLIDNLKDEFALSLLWIHVSTPEKFIIEKLKTFPYSPNHIFTGPDDALKRFFEHSTAFPDISDIHFDYTVDMSDPKKYTNEIKEITREIRQEFS